jgi:hypothetical protein
MIDARQSFGSLENLLSTFHVREMIRHSEWES